MLHKTADKEDTQSLSTKVPSSKAASFVAPAKRQMYRNTSTSGSKKVEQQICNMVTLEPEYVSFIVDDQVYFLDSSQSYVALSDYHYGIYNDRAEPVMLGRNCEPGAELLFANAKKPGININLYSIHKWGNAEYPSMLHFNMTKYNPGHINSVEARDVHIAYGDNLKPAHFVTVQNSKKGLLLSQVTNPKSKEKEYQLLYINLMKGNKVKNHRHISMKKQNSLGLSSEQADNQEQSKFDLRQFVYPEPETMRKHITLKPSEQILKMINSQFGDSILIITNQQVYEIEFEPNSIYLKHLDILPKLAKHLKKQAIEQEIKDACYIIDGLKIIFLTNAGFIGVVEAQNIQYAQSLYEVLAHANKKQEGKFKAVYSLIAKNAVETENGAVYIFKVGDSELSFERKFQMPVLGSEVTHYRANFLPRHDELILTRVTKQGKFVMELLSKNLLSPNNEFTKIYSSPYEPNPQKNPRQPIKVITSKSNTITCLLKEHTIEFYKFNEASSHSHTQQMPIEHLFSKTFFERPLYMSLDPYSSNLVILFKEFVKFYKFKYNDIAPYYTYNVRNVSYAGFTDNGQYVMVVSDDVLYFLNSFTFQTERTMEMYGDVRSVRFYDAVLYTLLRSKSGGKGAIGDVMTLQVYMWQEGQYRQVHEMKVEPTEALLTDGKQFMKASKTQILVYRKKPQIYQEQPSSQKAKNQLPVRQQEQKIELLTSKKIKLHESTQYPTCLTLCEQFGVLFVGTSHGRIYQYLWPFVTDEQSQNCYTVQCSTSEISRIVIGATLQKLYIYCKNTSILQMTIIQYIEGEQMSNIYVINPKTLHESPTLKYQFANREHLYPQYTAYIYEDIRQVNENIEEMKFILQKTRDDVQENGARTVEKNEGEIEGLKGRKRQELGAIKGEIQDSQRKYNQANRLIKEELVEAQKKYRDEAAKQKEKYEATLLELYKQASRLREQAAKIEAQQTKQKDVYLLQNAKIAQQIQTSGQKQQQQYQKRYNDLRARTDIYYGLERQEMNQKIDEQLQIFNNMLRDTVMEELNQEEQRKESLLGTRGYLMKEIVNYGRRRDQFQSLIMETHAQIDELNADQGSYEEKRKYLEAELLKKEKIIQEKERQLMSLIQGTDTMKKLKNTHEFELAEYEKQFEPILTKMTLVQGKVQKMNSEILREYLNKVEKDKQIMENKDRFQKLKKRKERKIKIKLDTHTKAQRLLAELQFLLENPLDQRLQHNLNIVSSGEKFQINEEQTIQKIQNARLLRRKRFIGKQIEEHQKREQQMFRNQNEINRHYNQNTMLVREFNNLKQLNRKLQEMLKNTQAKLVAAKGGNRLQTPRKKVNSMIEFKKISEKKLTPFQKHQQEYNQMFKKGLTSETKLTRSGHSMSLLKSLIRDVETIDSQYEKMEIVRERIKSFVNPEIRIRKTVATQRALFDRKKGETEGQM